MIDIDSFRLIDETTFYKLFTLLKYKSLITVGIICLVCMASMQAMQVYNKEWLNKSC